MPNSEDVPPHTTTRRQFLVRGSGALAGAALLNPLLGSAASTPTRRGSRTPPLLSGFRTPPLRARPGAYWLWPNGYFDREQLTRELQDAKEKGLSTLDIFDLGPPDEADVIPAGPAFMSPEATRGYAYAIREATRLDLEIGFITSSSWNAGGPWVTPAMGSKTLYGTETQVSGPGPVDAALPYPEVPEPKFQGREEGADPWADQEVYSKDVAVLAFPTREDRVIPDLTDVVDLTDLVEETSAGEAAQLTWDGPDGNWTVLRIVSTNNRERLVLPSPRSDGYMIDHLSARATEAHLRVIIDRLLEEFGTFEGTALEYMYLPSYEVRGLREWTPAFPEEFRRRRGYDVKPFLPVLFGWTVGSSEMSERFDFDRRLTVSDLLIDNHYRKATEVCDEYGLGLHAESGGPGLPLHDFPAEALSALNAVGIPRGEFWVRKPPEVDDSAEVIKAIGSALHIYGEQVGEMEAFTSFDHWEKGPFDLKPYADQVLAQGANRFVFHTFPHNPPEAGKPGWAYHAGTHVGPNRVWWPKAKPFISYLSRSSYLLQEGQCVADICFYYGHDAPRTIEEEPFDPNTETLGFGYDYDYVNTDVLLNGMSVQEGQIVLPSGMRYAALVLPNREDMPLEVLEKIEELVQAGATVVGPRPVRTPGLEEPQARRYQKRDARLRELADQLWGAVDGIRTKEHSYGQGRVVRGLALRDVLARQGVAPDFSFIGGSDDTALDFIHRRVGDRDLYFVVNLKGQWERVDGLFRVSGKRPERWLPDTGERQSCLLYEGVGDRTRVGLSLPPYGSAFVVFGEGEPENAPPDTDHVIRLTKDGEDLFPASPGRPAGPSPVDLHVSEQQGRLAMTAWEPGTYAVETAGGKHQRLDVSAQLRPFQIGGPWEVQFPEGRGAQPSVVFPELMSWTEHGEEGVRHFSGIATYVRSFELPQDAFGSGRRLMLDLGNVQHVAEVFLNGQGLGVVWKPPYAVEITGAAEPGKNRLRVEVANVWANRLLGDRGKLPEERLTRTNVSVERQRDTLVRSGLLGPVQVRFGTRQLL